MNDFSQIDGDSEFRNEMTQSYMENDSMLEMEYEDRVSGYNYEQEPDYGFGDDVCNGYAEDDLETYNQNEANDYNNED